jgi:methyltransferase (TIGR00027 family)
MGAGEAKDVSRTARYMALFRALETARGARAMFNDPYAERFLTPGLRMAAVAARAVGVGPAIEAAIDARWPGAWSSGVARTWLIDRLVAEAIEDGARQAVILGAGFDCRALRLASLARAPVFEVDRAPLLAEKRRRLGHARTSSQTHPVHVSVDFLRDDIGARLMAAGFQLGRRTIFLWEGVTNYLDASAVSRVFDVVRRISTPGSRIVFTYIHADVLTGTFPAPGLEAMSGRLAASGESWTFGFHPTELESYLAGRGFKLASDTSAEDYRPLAMGKRARGLVGYEFYRVAVADRTEDA